MQSLVKFVPHSVQIGGGRFGFRLCHRNNIRKWDAFFPAGRTVRVRFIKGGLMYANRAVRSAAPAWVKKAPQYGQKVAVAPVAAQAPVRPAAPMSMRQMLGGLTAIEAANRAAALKAYRANQ